MLGKDTYQRPIVLGIPQSGMVVAAEIARVLRADLGVVVVRKLRAPYQPELTIGAVTADGIAFVDTVLAEEVGANRLYLLEEQRRQAEAARHQQERLVGAQGVPIAGRDVLVVTAGLSTGAGAIAATRRVLAAGASRVVVAAPIGPPDAIERVRREDAEVVCLLEAPGFLSVAQYYDDFQPIDDKTVRSLLRRR